MAGIMFLDSIIMLIFGWYLDKVIPQEFGVPEKWNFCFRMSYWSTEKVPLPSTFQNLVKMQSSDNSIYIKSPNGDESPPNYQRRSTVETSNFLQTSINTDSFINSKLSTKSSYEPENQLMKNQLASNECIKIINLRKEFKNANEQRVAVKKLNLNFFCGQITCLLGHNGAGKTTTISMLSGLIRPSSGDAIVFGNSITNNLMKIRKMMGVCP